MVEGVELRRHHLDGRALSLLVWRPGRPWRVAATTLLGGGLGERWWWCNAQVPMDYGRVDGAAHLAELAAGAGLVGPGVGMLTGVDVAQVRAASDDGVEVLATVGLGTPTWAAAPDLQSAAAESMRPGTPPGTVNLLVVLPVPLGDAALVNAVATATEAKVQALVELGVPGTGTASDAVCVACPVPGPGSTPEPFGGPRSRWGAPLARAVHRAVLDGAAGGAAAGAEVGS